MCPRALQIKDLDAPQYVANQCSHLLCPIPQFKSLLMGSSYKIVPPEQDAPMQSNANMCPKPWILKRESSPTLPKFHRVVPFISHGQPSSLKVSFEIELGSLGFNNGHKSVSRCVLFAQEQTQAVSTQQKNDKANTTELRACLKPS